jgi:hypothetical protein
MQLHASSCNFVQLDTDKHGPVIVKLQDIHVLYGGLEVDTIATPTLAQRH